MIDAIKYGLITVDGKVYDHDILILPNGELKHWKRAEEMMISQSDLKEIFAAKPKRLLLGNGMYRMLGVLPNIRNEIQANGIELEILQTQHAIEKFNSLKDTSDLVLAIHIRD